MILVTGGSGLLGKEVITQLVAQGKPVLAIYHTTPLPDFNSSLVRQEQCDILDVIRLEEVMQLGVTQIYHCAAIVSFHPRRKQDLFKINIEGTANIVNAALDAGVAKIVHVSSVAALGRLRQGEPVKETMNWTPETSNSHYGQSKYLGELEVWRGVGEGLEAVVVNPSIILGAGDWNSGSAQLFKNVFEEFPWYSEGATGFVDVRDVAACMLQLMDSSISGQRFIVSAENKTYREVFNAIASAFDKKLPHKKVTPLLAKIVWRLEAIKSRFTGKAPLVTKETAATALATVSFDNSKLQEFLPDFNYRNFQETIEQTCAALELRLTEKPSSNSR